MREILTHPFCCMEITYIYATSLCLEFIVQYGFHRFATVYIYNIYNVY